MRFFLAKTTTLLLALATLWAGAAEAATIRLATIVPDGSSLAVAINNSAARVEKLTGGELKFKVYPGGVMGNDAVILRKMRSGQIHGASFTAGGISAEARNFQILSLPLLLRSYAEVDAVREKVDPILMEELRKNGFEPMSVIESGLVYMMSDTPIEGPDDFRGKKIWVPEGDPFSAEIFKMAKVPPVPLQITDVLTSLQSGLLDTVSTSPIGALVLQWFTKVKYFTETPLLYSYGTFAFSERGWKIVPDKYKTEVTKIFGEELAKVEKQNRVDNADAMGALKKQGLKFVSIADNTMPELEAISKKAIDSLVAQGLIDAPLLKKIQEIKATVSK